jgi:polar amino acid transport system substrate-binding protein
MLEMIDEPIRVAHDSGFPPFAEVKDGKSEGLAVDIFRAAAARAGIDVKFVPVSFEQRQLTLADGRLMRTSLSPSRRNVCSYSISATCWL